MPVTKNTTINIAVKSLVRIAPQYHTLTFERPPQFDYQSGDWIDLAFSPAVTGGRTYSLSSSPTEPDLSITFREGLSPLKRRLGQAIPGDSATIVQYGNDYGFQLRSTKASTLIAGGVGIAPFRSMLKEMADTRGKNDVHLLYLNTTDSFLFATELEQWKALVPNLKIDYIVTKDLSRKKREKILRELINNIHRQFYIAGPPGMVTSSQLLLDSIGVSPRDIKTDVFGGY